jgi:hypothetical protein
MFLNDHRNFFPDLKIQPPLEDTSYADYADLFDGKFEIMVSYSKFEEI